MLQLVMLLLETKWFMSPCCVWIKGTYIYIVSHYSKHASLPCPLPIVPPTGPVLPRASLPCTAPVPHRGHWLSPAQGVPPLPCPCPSQGPLSLSWPERPFPALTLSLTGATASVLPRARIPPLHCPCPSQGPLSLCCPGRPSPALPLSLTGTTGSVLPILPYVISKDVYT